ncbi:MAG TPA: hypothetical protein EYH38_11705, partial [Leucothrix sp.]|nr:hypothetical protein [Leucothrix sp.]
MAELTANNLQAFNNDGELRFIEKAKKRVKKHMGDEYYACFTDEKIHNFTLLGIKRARAHNLISEGEIFDYLWLMVKFGAYFDLDVHYQWLYEYIDGDPENLMQGRTIHGVDAGKNYLRTYYSKSNVWLERFKRLKKDYGNADSSLTVALDRGRLVQAMKSCNPDNQLIVIEKGLLEKIYAQAKPQDLGIKASASHALWFILTIDLGFRFYDNPLYPRIREVL